MPLNVVNHAIFFLAVLYVIPVSIVAGECEHWQKNHPAWLWCDDFESSDTNLNSRYEDVGTTGMSVVNTASFEGTQCLRQHYNKGQIDAGWVCRVANPGFPDHLFMRWYHKFDIDFEGYPEKMARIRYRDRTTWITFFAVHAWIQPNGIMALDVLAKNSSQADSSGWLHLDKSNFSFADKSNAGRWVCFEMEVKLNTSGNTDGLYRLWIDDTLKIERTGVDLRGNTSYKINEAELDCYWGEGSPKAQDRYYDNFVISTAKIGPVNATASKNKKETPASHWKSMTPAIKSMYRNVTKLPEILLNNSGGRTLVTFYNLLGVRIGAIAGEYSPSGTSVDVLKGENSLPAVLAKGTYVIDMQVNGIHIRSSFLSF